MNAFFDRFKPKGSSNSNPLAGLFGGGTTTSFSGTGQSLGGNVKPGIVIAVTLSETGPLGIQIERSSTNTAIVSSVVPDTQAAAAGIQRGDILCFAETNGTEEINYEMFLELARSDQRPLCFEIRRIVAPSTSKGKGSSTTTTTSIHGTKVNTSTQLSAEAFARKQAMIAAAEKREKDHQKKYNSTNSSGSSSKPALKQILSTAEKNRLEQERQKRVLEQSSAASHSEFVQKAKHLEQQTASQLGYNPYATQSVSAGLARNVVTSSSATTQQATTVPSSSSGTSLYPAPGMVTSPPALTAAATDTSSNASRTLPPQQPQQQQQPSMEFQQAFETTVTSTPDHTVVINSITILRKLIINATTKGQSTNQDDAVKYRKIRFMTNPKIRASVTDIPGAMDLLLSVGFQIHEESILDNDDIVNSNESKSESVLLYPPSTPGPIWLPTALQQMERYVQQQ